MVRQEDVCIVGALAEEAKAFIKVTEDQGFPRFQSAFNARRQEYYYTTIKNNKDEPLNIQVSWQTRYGPQEAILHLQRTLEEFRPRFISMTGICAGDRRRVKLGDIIVAERTFLSDTGKLVLDKDEHRRHEYDTMTRFPPENVLHFVRGFEGWKPAVEKLSRPISKRQQRDWLLKTLLEAITPSIDTIGIRKLDRYAPDWRKIVQALQEGPDAYLTEDRTLRNPTRVKGLFFGIEKFPFIDPPMPEVYIAPMASGNAVRADDPFDDIRGPVRGTIAVDMEGASFYRATTDFPAVHALLVKAVSDYADIDKDDSYHTYASEASAAYMLSFIREYVTTSRIPVLTAATPSASNQGTSPPVSQQPEPKDAQPQTNGLNLFYAFAPEDEALKSKLDIHLTLLRRQHYITEWHSHKLVAGGSKTQEKQEGRERLEQAKIILLLISPYFLASDNYDEQMLPALEMQRAGNARIIPILLRPTDDLQETPIGDLLTIPRNNKPVTDWEDRDAAFAEIAREIRGVINQVKK